ncbi:cyclohexadienyl dehydrogenase [Rubritalea halochordaticola]|uniref:Cyclohexadienyl dehydrogenase n=1 Tax=Rubritalea halochordaticola TaxID=714537 RepID=A0ABP9V5H8_9BACT
MFERVTILGPGLLGGSVALSAVKKLSGCQVTLWGRREEPLKVAQSVGIESVTTDLEAAVKEADLVILATPVGVMPKLVEKIVEVAGDREILLTDVGSVKRMVHEMLAPTLKGTKIRFVGSHPMAGSEQTGMEAAKDDLLDGATCLVTNDGGVDEDTVKQVEAFWLSLGCRVRRMSAEDHDYAVARVSHFPHVLACVGATVGLAFDDIADLCGGGMRDTTRVAGGDPTLWTEIMMENRDALQRSMRESIGDLVKLMDMLEKEDREALHAYLEEAKTRRSLI